MKAKLPIIVFLLLAAAGGTVCWMQFGPKALADGQIRVSGNIETTEVQIAFKIPGRVMRRFVDEGVRVAKGQVIAQLDTADLQATVEVRRAELAVAEAASAALQAGSRPQEIESAQAAVDKATHALLDLEAGSRPEELAVAKATVASAQADLSRLEADFHRASALFQRKTISSEEYDKAKASYDVAIEKHRQSVEQLRLAEKGFREELIKQARSALAQAKAQFELVKEGPRKEDKDQGKARVAQAKAALQYAETQLSYATVVSPIEGVVLSKNIEEGEYVAPGTAVVTIGDIANVWLRAYIEETDLGRVCEGQRAWITTDSFSLKVHDKLEGRVSFISQEAEFTPKNVQTQKERVKLVYRIKIDIKNPIVTDPNTKKLTWELKPGMPADAVIEVQ